MAAKRWSLLGLGLLASITAALVVLAFVHVQPSEVSAVPAPPPGRTAAATPSPSTTASTSPTTSAGAPTTTPAASPGPVRGRSLEDARTMLRTEARLQVVVLGDGSGSGETGWVSQWAQSLTNDRVVEVRTTVGDRIVSRSLGAGNRHLVLRNASDSQLTLPDAITRIDQLVPADTDLVLLSFGHQESEGRISADLERLWLRLPRTATAVVVLQNPERGTTQQTQRNRMRTLNDWGQANQVPIVDVYEAFTRAPEPLVELLDRDGVTPSDAGARVWKDELVRQLG